MNTKIKNMILLIIGVSIFLGTWLISMLSGMVMLIGFGLGILLHNYINGFIKGLQRNIYLSEKAEMQHKKLELEKELEKLKGEIK